MPKIRKVKRRKTYKVSINRKRLRNKMRKLPNITCPQIKAEWENSKSINMNLLQMGLTYDPNKSLKIPSMKAEMAKNVKQIASGNLIVSNTNYKKQKRIPKKVQVAMALEEDANAPRESMFRLPNGQVQFLTYLMDKYGDNYEDMARDKKNYYQLTWRQIRSKINTFKKIPEQYADYLLKKGEIILEDAEPLEVTMKKISVENVRKYCAPKKVKKVKETASEWTCESVNNEEQSIFGTMDMLEDKETDDKIKLLKKEKKLALFSDDEIDYHEETDTKLKKNLTTKCNKVKQSNFMETIVCQESSDKDLDEDNDDSLEFENLCNMSDEDVSDDDMMDDDFDTDTE